MAVSVKISEIIDAIEFNNDFRESYINKKTGKVYNIGEEYFRWAEDEEMYYSIKGKGAFHRFENNIYRYGLADEWYKCRDEYLKDLAVNWCKENGFTILDE